MKNWLVLGTMTIVAVAAVQLRQQPRAPSWLPAAERIESSESDLRPYSKDSANRHPVTITEEARSRPRQDTPQRLVDSLNDMAAEHDGQRVDSPPMDSSANKLKFRPLPVNPEPTRSLPAATVAPSSGNSAPIISNGSQADRIRNPYFDGPSELRTERPIQPERRNRGIIEVKTVRPSAESREESSSASPDDPLLNPWLEAMPEDAAEQTPLLKPAITPNPESPLPVQPKGLSETPSETEFDPDFWNASQRQAIQPQATEPPTTPPEASVPDHAQHGPSQQQAAETTPSGTPSWSSSSVPHESDDVPVPGWESKLVSAPEANWEIKPFPPIASANGDSSDPSGNMRSGNSAFEGTVSRTNPTFDGMDLVETPWWQNRVAEPILGLPQHEDLDVQTAVLIALQNSPRIQAISQEPLIAETEIGVSRAKFDPVLFAKSLYDDRVDPVGNTLTTGGLPFLEDNIWTGNAGLRRKTFSGADIELQQRLGFQNSNSRFFTPQDQGTAILSLNVEQPLLRGRGRYINRSQILLAQTTTDAQWDEYCANLQNELLEVANAYWALYAARAAYLQKQDNFQRGKAVLVMIEGRQQFDTQAIQVAQARAAVRSRETELANAFRDIRNAEVNLRRLMGRGVSAANAQIELVTRELPLAFDASWDLAEVAETALANSPEIRQAVKQTRLAAVRNQVASNQVLPDLSLLFGTYVAALDGGTGIERAWQDQFSSTPGFSAGLSFELPYRNRAAHNRLRQSELELLQAQALVEQATIEITADVQKAFYRVRSAIETLVAAHASLEAARFELAQNEKRWEMFALVEGDWAEGQTQSLVLDQLLISQQKLLAAETVVVTAEEELKKSQVFLRRAMGILVQCNDRRHYTPSLGSGDYLPKMDSNSQLDTLPDGSPVEGGLELNEAPQTPPPTELEDHSLTSKARHQETTSRFLPGRVVSRFQRSTTRPSALTPAMRSETTSATVPSRQAGTTPPSSPPTQTLTTPTAVAGGQSASVSNRAPGAGEPDPSILPLDGSASEPGQNPGQPSLNARDATQAKSPSPFGNFGWQ